jgi:hypothetical protein
MAQFIQVSRECLEEGVEVRKLDGVEVRMFSAAKSIADAFKFRRRIGLDVALEALQAFQDRYAKRHFELERAATACRVSRVIKPYLEALETLKATGRSH